MRYLHAMVRVKDLDASMRFYRDLLGLVETRRADYEAGRFTLVYLAAPADKARAEAEQSPEVELTYNWDDQDYDGGRNFGHLAFQVDDIYAACQRLMDGGVVVNRPPRDGHMGVAVVSRIERAAEQADLHPRRQIQPVAQGASAKTGAFRRGTGVEEGQGRLLRRRRTSERGQRLMLTCALTRSEAPVSLRERSERPR